MAASQSEPFPIFNADNGDSSSEKEAEDGGREDAYQRPSATSHLPAPTRTRTSSLMQSFIESNPPLGMWQATGEIGSKIPTLPEIRNGAFAEEGWTHEGQMERRGTNPYDIYRQRMERTSSASTRTKKSTQSAGPGAPLVIVEERHEYFPRSASRPLQESLAEEAATIQPNGQVGQIEKKNTDTAEMQEKDSPMSCSQRDTNKAQVVQIQTGPDETGTYPNGYRFPKKHTWTQSTMIGLQAFWKFFLTPFGFIVTIYGLNIIGWGAMIFFVLLKAAPAMCHPNCEDDSSARQKWIEIDSQILNALFCVTAYCLFPWRARDFFYLMRWRLGGKQLYHRRLAGIYRSWYRLPGSDKLSDDIGPPPVYNKKNPRTPESPPPYSEEEIAELEGNPAIPIPATSMPDAPLTGIRAPPSKSWTLDLVVWMYMLNTGFQVCLCVWMWHYNRFNRPSWGTGVFITFGCLSGIVAGVCVFVEGSRVKSIEGIPVQEYDVVESVEDYQERKANEDKKEAKKEARLGQLRTHRVIRSEKLKGQQWFTRK
ncbi:hypothetical protein A1O3_09603 [Capronia epimyces CBS 606.96]|uniref:Uncharacterized protein n=1 Tax=Capronia epimyces CBS 606.96 TaxID=1182542 RepID=W9XA88_9EURO|nr:uncharacterized protein A1O3_09603 [Capronia epimyces CBS 606.96]EXJ77377.1 hypothetical protein A1O3_09603 [Capronia epimyces CBS 606.96]